MTGRRTIIRLERLMLRGAGHFEPDRFRAALKDLLVDHDGKARQPARGSEGSAARAVATAIKERSK